MESRVLLPRKAVIQISPFETQGYASYFYALPHGYKTGQLPGRRSTDDEIVGTDAQVSIVVVDLFDQKTSETTCTARKRLWSVIPDTEGDGTDALIYKGSFKAAGEIVKGTATTTDGWKTCTFSEA